MLIVKGLEIMHHESVAQNAKQGSLVPAIFACLVAFGGAMFLLVLSVAQVSTTPSIAGLGAL